MPPPDLINQGHIPNHSLQTISFKNRCLLLLKDITVMLNYNKSEIIDKRLCSFKNSLTCLYFLFLSLSKYPLFLFIPS